MEGSKQLNLKLLALISQRVLNAMRHLNHLAIKTEPHSQSFNITSPFPCLSLAFWWVGLVWKILVLQNWADKRHFIWTELVVPQDTLPDLLKSGQSQSPLIFQTVLFLTLDQQCSWAAVNVLRWTWCLASVTWFFVFVSFSKTYLAMFQKH